MEMFCARIPFTWGGGEGATTIIYSFEKFFERDNPRNKCFLSQALTKFQSTQKVTTKSGIDQENELLNESAAKETSLNLHIMDLENETKQVSETRKAVSWSISNGFLRFFSLRFCSYDMNWIVFGMNEIECYKKIVKLDVTNQMRMRKNFG